MTGPAGERPSLAAKQHITAAGHGPSRGVSHVGRGRLTKGQRHALGRLWSRFGVAPQDGPLELERLFGRSAPCRLDVGFGMGDGLVAAAAAWPERNHLGVELYVPGIGSTLIKLERQQLHNVRLVHGDAGKVLSEWIPRGSLEAVSIFFPDPWPKKRHHKRRLVQAPFARLLAGALIPGGRICLATDWEDYAAHMLHILGETPELVNAAGAGRYAPRPPERTATKFEARGRRLGHGVWDLVFIRNQS